MKKIDIEELKAKISKEELYDLYITQNKSQKDIQKLYNLSDREFYSLKEFYKITKRLKSHEIDNILTKDVLQKEYLKNKLSAKAIGKKYKIDEETVLNRLNKYNIEKSNITIKKKHEVIKSILYDQYIIQNKSIDLISKENKVSEKYISKCLSELKIFKSKDKIKESQKHTLNSNYTKQELKKLYKKRAIHQTIDLENRYTEALNNITKENFYKYYIEENHTKKEVLEHYNISNKIFKKLYIYFNINKYEYLKNKAPSKEELYQLYLVEKKSIKQIAIESKCSRTVINRLIIKYNLNIDQKEKFKRSFKKRKINGTVNTSKAEDQIAFLLESKFCNVKRQYKSDLYPFACDFYIPEIDTYIEYQGDWSHGKDGRKILGPYNSNNKEHQKVIEKWKEKEDRGHPRYKGAIDVWTIRDPLKRETARKNNLNWLEFFTINEFLSWYRDQTGVLLLTYNPL